MDKVYYDIETGVQGVTELEECERTQDLWLRSVQDEFRRGELTVETHAFLHGKPTMQPGSVFEGEVKCATKKVSSDARKHKPDVAFV